MLKYICTFYTHYNATHITKLREIMISCFCWIEINLTKKNPTHPSFLLSSLKFTLHKLNTCTNLGSYLFTICLGESEQKCIPSQIHLHKIDSYQYKIYTLVPFFYAHFSNVIRLHYILIYEQKSYFQYSSRDFYSSSLMYMQNCIFNNILISLATLWSFLSF